MPGGCLYTLQPFIDAHPDTVQALASALVRANTWIQRSNLDDILRAVPESYLLGDAAVYRDALIAGRPSLSADGLVPEGAAETALRALSLLDPSLHTGSFDLAACYTNEFARRAASTST